MSEKNHTFRNYVIALWELILYGDFWIALAAYGLSRASIYEYTGSWAAGNVPNFLFFSTLFVYALHRIVGIEKVKDYTEKGRYAIIYTYRKHIFIYAVLGACMALFYFLQFSSQLLMWLMAPSLLAIAYVLPLFGGKRLRDFDFVKIFFVALVWAWACSLIPLIELGYKIDGEMLLRFASSFFFIFAITVPFDIRDLDIDDHSRVKTLPSLLGVERSRQLSYLLLAFAIGIDILSFGEDYISLAQLLAHVLTYIYCIVLIRVLKPGLHDYYYTGLLDGSIILLAILIFIPSLF